MQDPRVLHGRLEGFHPKMECAVKLQVEDIQACSCLQCKTSSAAAAESPEKENFSG
jgi:hypothetical protein